MFPCCVDIQGIVSTHVETVVLLSQQKSTDRISVEVDLTELETTKAEAKATYAEIDKSDRNLQYSV